MAGCFEGLGLFSCDVLVVGHATADEDVRLDEAYRIALAREVSLQKWESLR